ncbi:MAG: DUF1461 domain-containing protein [Dehalococcoidia bacterium]|nr:DUF1461 domain-containing protein [Dehalococcoidia bacterium]
MKILGRIAGWIFIIAMPALLISASIGGAFNSQWLYEYGFQKYGVSQTTGLAPAELSKAAKALISYFNSGYEYISVTVTKDGKPFELFTREESIHFKDVKGLVWLDYTVLLISFLYALGYALACVFCHRPAHRRRLAKGVMGGSTLTLGLMLALGIGFAVGFEQLFLQFHFLAFTNQFWSAPGYMLKLFPGGFWFDATVFCVSAAIGLAVVPGLAAFFYLRLSKER